MKSINKVILVVMVMKKKKRNKPMRKSNIVCVSSKCEEKYLVCGNIK